MTEKEKKLVFEVSTGQLTKFEFYRLYPVDIRAAKDQVIKEIRSAIDNGSIEDLDCAISLIWLSGTNKQFVDILNELLINPNHRKHQFVAKTIQDLKDPSSITYIRKVLESNFEYLAYTCSESDAIAKWFSWALCEIGTKEAIDLMKEYAESSDEGIRNEMTYRLGKL